MGGCYTLSTPTRRVDGNQVKQEKHVCQPLEGSQNQHDTQRTPNRAYLIGTYCETTGLATAVTAPDQRRWAAAVIVEIWSTLDHHAHCGSASEQGMECLRTKALNPTNCQGIVSGHFDLGRLFLVGVAQTRRPLGCDRGQSEAWTVFARVCSAPSELPHSSFLHAFLLPSNQPRTL